MLSLNGQQSVFENFLTAEPCRESKVDRMEERKWPFRQKNTKVGFKYRHSELILDPILDPILRNLSVISSEWDLKWDPEWNQNDEV